MVNESKFSEKVIHFYREGIPKKVKIPAAFSWIDPMDNEETIRCVKAFYTKYFDDHNSRTAIFGINPGRFGAGVTGIPFTDPKILAEKCGIENPFHKRFELSAIFIYEWIEAMGGISTFYKQFFISSLCPLGFLTKNINCNYYDDKKLQKAVTPFIIKSMWTQIELGLNRSVAYCLGKGKNYAYFNTLNEKHQFFEKLIPLPHPRWIMQYRRKSKDQIMDEMIAALRSPK